MKKILQIFSVILLSFLAVAILGTTNLQKANAADCSTAGNASGFINSYEFCATQIRFTFDPAHSIRDGSPIFMVGSPTSSDGKISNPITSSSGKFIKIFNQPDGTPSWAEFNPDGTAIDGAQGTITDNNVNVNVAAPNASPDGTPYCAINITQKCISLIDGATIDSPKDFSATVKNLNIAAINQAASDTQGCEDRIDNALSFFLCPLSNAIAKTVDSLTGFLTDQLHIVSLTSQNTTANGGISEGFDRFRNLANSLYVIVFLIIILGNFVNICLENYTIKKLLPRLIAAIILTQFAYLICSLAVDFSNVLLDVIPSLVQGGATTTLGGATQTQFINLINGQGAGIGALGGIGFFLITLIFAVVALVVILIALAYIAFRNIALIILVFISPIAIAAWVLPQTETFAKKWANWFIKLLLMGPIVGLILASAVVVTQVLSNSGNDFMKFIAAFVPIFALILIPKSLKWSGDLMHATGDLLAKTSVGKAATGAVKKSSEEGGIAKAKGKTLAAIGSGSKTSFGRGFQARAAATQSKADKAKRGLYDSLGVKDLIKLDEKGDKMAQGALRKKYREKVVEGKQAFDAGFTLSAKEQEAYNDLASAVGVTPAQGSTQYLDSVKEWQAEKDARLAAGGGSVAPTTPSLAPPSGGGAPAPAPTTTTASAPPAAPAGSGSTGGQPGTQSANPAKTRTTAPSTSGWQQRQSGLYTPPSSGNSGGNTTSSVPPLTGPNGQPFTPPAPSGPTSQVPPSTTPPPPPPGPAPGPPPDFP